MVHRHYIVISSYIIYIYMFVFHISHPTSRLRANNFEESPESWRSSPQESRAFVKRVVSTFLFKARWTFVTFRDVKNFVFNEMSKMCEKCRPLSRWSFLLMQFGWPFRQIGDWGWKGRKCQDSFLVLVWFYQSGHLTTVIPDHPNDLVRSC